ncbi:MAG TPA: DUF547 domain-containing protein [Vicinamibacterales bacterium]|nr:DUF547 domain-containing protein [Vicinamibacterales bacterium]
MSAVLRFSVCVFLFAVLLAAPAFSQQPPSTADPLHRPFDQMLDLYVRDGLVYYRAVRADRARLTRYVTALGGVARATYNGWTREEKIAFWINAYNAFALQTAASAYPIRGNSIRNVPGAFDKRQHRAAGRMVTLDQIENTILQEFKDPRVYFSLGRAAMGSGRLRSEAYTSARLEEQLGRQTTEFLQEQEHVRIDQLDGTLAVSPIIGWHEAEFIAAYGGAERTKFANRSPIERAVLALVDSVLLPAERAYLDKGEFKVVYQEFDWTLNELK